jgi:hypothetical protein
LCLHAAQAGNLISLIRAEQSTDSQTSSFSHALRTSDSHAVRLLRCPALSFRTSRPSPYPRKAHASDSTRNPELKCIVRPPHKSVASRPQLAYDTSIHLILHISTRYEGRSTAISRELYAYEPPALRRQIEEKKKEKEPLT